MLKNLRKNFKNERMLGTCLQKKKSSLADKKCRLTKKKLPFAIENEQEEQEECLNPHRPHKLPALYHIYMYKSKHTMCTLKKKKKLYIILYYMQFSGQSNGQQ